MYLNGSTKMLNKQFNILKFLNLYGVTMICPNLWSGVQIWPNCIVMWTYAEGRGLDSTGVKPKLTHIPVISSEYTLL